LEGIKRTSATIQSSDIVCTIVDSSIPVSAADLLLYKNVQTLLPADSKKLYLFNKCDVKDHDFDKSVQGLGHVKLYISCKSGEGMENFKNTLINIAIPGHDSVESAIMINNSRHKTSLEHALEGIKISIESLKNGMSDEFVAVDLRRAVDYLGEIIGLTTPDDVLNNIFSKFCIGK
jgi:tRNA modification GTPase